MISKLQCEQDVFLVKHMQASKNQLSTEEHGMSEKESTNLLLIIYYKYVI